MSLAGSDLNIDAGGYLVLGAEIDPSLNGGVPVDYAYATFSLSNGADAIQLAWNGVLVDAVVYDGGDTFPDPIGASLSLDPDAMQAVWNDDGSLWCLAESYFGAGDRGTPGLPNDHCPGSAVCGNGVHEDGEACDDGNAVVGDGCNPDCTEGPLYVCGNAAVEGDEACDDGNQAGGDGCSAACAIEVYAEGDVVFTELMINPELVDDFHGEWIEVLNATDSIIDLAGWSLGDGANEIVFFDPLTPTLLAPGQRFVIGRDGDSTQNGGLVLDHVAPQMSLKNLSDTVQLVWDELVIDAVSWDQSAGWDVPEGASLALAAGAEDAVSNDLQPSWCAATSPYGDGDLGTPGSPDTTCLPPTPAPGEVVLTEIRRRGPPTAPDYEFFEVYNLAPHTVGLDGLVVTALGAGEATLNGGVVLSGGFAWVAPNLPPASLGGTTPDATYDGFQLPDDPATVTLSRPDGELLDLLPVTGAFPGLAIQAMSLDPAAYRPDDNDAAALWCVAPASPGQAGGCGLTEHLVEGALVITEILPGDDWAIEVTNLAGDAVSLLGLRL
ncbi:MAG: lamin tail domain-containing protein, partial [Myxococcota bacterium]|nr:lamin tail domain-containing protein [Myxococcota bacterium]